VWKSSGFTLIELSIVLVIIGLIVGGVLTGQSLTRAAEVRAQLTQIEKYNSAVNTFRSKYGALPGDLNNIVATAFGFQQRTNNFQGTGDNNGVIEGYLSGGNGFVENCETLLFWQDLTVGNPSAPMNINLVDGTFQSAIQAGVCQIGSITTSQLPNYLPNARLGSGNFVFVFSTNAVNYFGISKITAINYQMTASAAMTVQQAYMIDKKADDGYPITGNVIATLINGAYAENTPLTGAAAPLAAHTSNPAVSTDCFDSSATPSYAVTLNNGANVNCSISFRFQ